MSKKNSLSQRKKQHAFDLKREREDKEKREKKLKAKADKMKVDSDNKKKNRKGFKVAKKAKLKSALTKAKAAQAMEVDS